MSDSYYLACRQCKSYVWVGQSQNTDPPFCFYSGEPVTMQKLKMFLWNHMGHDLIINDSQILTSDGILAEDKHGYVIQGKLKKEQDCG